MEDVSGLMISEWLKKIIGSHGLDSLRVSFEKPTITDLRALELHLIKMAQRGVIKIIAEKCWEEALSVVLRIWLGLVGHRYQETASSCTRSI